LLPDDQVHPDTHALTMVNNVIGVVNYVIAARPSLLNSVIADKHSLQSQPAMAVDWITRRHCRESSMRSVRIHSSPGRRYQIVVHGFLGPDPYRRSTTLGQPARRRTRRSRP
jgi:hypothetical protein